MTHTYFDDGTCIQYEYDAWRNRTMEQDRKGFVTKRAYDVYGNLIEETLPSGQEWKYEYTKGHQLQSKKANTGEEQWFAYNAQGFVIEENEKIKPGVYRQITYERDSYGRVVAERENEQGTTSFVYEEQGEHLLTEPVIRSDALSNETVYTYDRMGRRTSIQTAYGTVEFRYNEKNALTYIRDGNGNETRRFYDKMGNLTEVLSPNQGTNGRAWTYEYDFFDQLIGGTDPVGNHWRQERNLEGSITKEISPRGYKEGGQEEYGTTYDYDFDNRKIRTHYPDGTIERYFYDPNGNLIKKVRPAYYDKNQDDGKGITYQYDCMNRLIEIQDEEGQIQKQWVYNQAGHLEQEIDANGNATYYTYDLLGNVLEVWKPIEEIQVEESFETVKQTDPRIEKAVAKESLETSQDSKILYQVTLYEYDKNSNKIKEKRGLEKVERGKYPKRYHELSFGYDALNRLTSVMDRYGAKTVYRYDCLNQKIYESFQINKDTKKVIHYRYDAACNLIEKREELEERHLKRNGKRKTVWAITQYEYDKNGNCIKETSPKGYVKEKVYNVLDQVIEEKEYDKQHGIERIFTYEYDPNGNLVKRVNQSQPEEPTERNYQYDTKDRLTHYKNEIGATTRVFYDPNDRICKVVKPKQYDKTADDGLGISYTYDCHDKVKRVIGTDGAILEEYQYDPIGNVSSHIKGEQFYQEYAYNLAGNPIAFYEGRRNAHKRKAVQSLEYNAQGIVTKVQDGNQNEIQFVLDDWGRIVEVHSPDGGVEQYTYDYAGNITSTTDANGNTITYTYNSFGQVSEITDQEGKSEYFYYNEEGHQVEHHDRNGNEIHRMYTIDGNLAYERAIDPSSKYAVINQYVYYPDGTIKRATGGGITYKYTYTKTGQLKTKSANGKALLSYIYDQNGNRKTLIEPSGKQVTYTYDSMDRMTKVEDDRGQTLAEYQYTKSGKLQSTVLGNGIKTEYNYFEDEQLESLVTVTNNGNVLLNFNYAYDGNGNCIKKAGKRYQHFYGYDKKNQLITAEYNGVKEYYTYDLVGNRKTKEVGGVKEEYFYNKKNQLVQLKELDKVTDYTYDRQGNLLGERTQTPNNVNGNLDNIIQEKNYQYDSLNRQQKVVTPNFIQKNVYDAEGLRYQTVENGERFQFAFDRRELLFESKLEKEKSDQVESIQDFIRYFRGNDVLALEEEGETSYYIQDEMRSIMFLVDSDYTIRKSYEYDAFGSIIKEQGQSRNRLTYTEQFYDTGLGQYYLRARYYNPRIARFIQEDPYRGDGLNLYAYCHNHPVGYYDPSGYMKLDCNQNNSDVDAWKSIDEYRRKKLVLSH